MQPKNFGDNEKYGSLAILLPIWVIGDKPKGYLKKSLTKSFDAFGILSPLIVKEDSTDPLRYSVIDGMKRLQYAQEHKWKEIPALILSGRVPKEVYEDFKQRQFKAEKLYPTEYQKEVYQITRSTNPNYSAVYKNKDGGIVWRNKADVRKAVAKYRQSKPNRDKQYYLNDFSASKRFVGKATIEDLKLIQKMIDKKLAKVEE